MNFTDYLTALTTTTFNLTSSLSYGYGDLATKEINSLRGLLFEAEKMIPVIETEACMAEVEELDREERLFNYWMTMLYGNGDVISSMDSHNSNKANRLKRRKQNKKHHKADRYHGKCFEGRDEEGRRIYKDRYCRFPISDRVRNHSALKADAREQDYFCTPSAFERQLEEEDKKEMQRIENYNILLSALNNLEKGKYIFLLSYWNGKGWEDSESSTFEFNGVISHENVKERILKESKNHFGFPEMVMDTVHGVQGMSMMWHGYYEEEEGYVKYTFLPVSEI